MKKKYKKWIESREYLNHDILCNQVLNEISSMKLTPGNVQPRRLSIWQNRIDEYRNLIASSIEVLDASLIIDSNIFDCWSDDVKSTMKPIFGDIFLMVNNVPSKIAELSCILEQCSNMTKKLLDISMESRTSEMVTQLESLMDRLNKAISALPRLPNRAVSDE